MIVLDTHVIIWDALKPEMLSQKAKRAIRAANDGDGIVFCQISLWEIAMLMRKGRLRVDVEFREFIELVFDSNRYLFRGITPEIAELSADLMYKESIDPADAIIAATAMMEKTDLVTADKKLRKIESLSTIW